MKRYGALLALPCLASVLLAGCGESSVLGTNGQSGGSNPGTPAALPKGETLQLKLSADKMKLVPGEPVTFTTTIVNTHTGPINLFLGQSYSGVCFASGVALQAESEAKAITKGQWRIGFCGTSSYPLFVAIPAKGEISYSVKGFVKVNEKGPYINFGHVTHDSVILTPIADGKYTFRAVHEVLPECKTMFNPNSRWIPKTPNVQMGWAPDIAAPFWDGKMRSNDVVLEVSSTGIDRATSDRCSLRELVGVPALAGEGAQAG